MKSSDKFNQDGSGIVTAIVLAAIGSTFMMVFSNTFVTMKSLRVKARESFEQSFEQENSFATLSALIRSNKIYLENGNKIILDPSLNANSSAVLVSHPNHTKPLSRGNPLVLDVKTCSTNSYVSASTDLEALHSGSALSGGCSTPQLAEKVTHQAKIVEIDNDGWLRVTMTSSTGQEHEARMMLEEPRTDATVTPAPPTNGDPYVIPAGTQLVIKWTTKNALKCEYIFEDNNGVNKTSLVSSVVKNNDSLTAATIKIDNFPNYGLTFDLNCYGSYGTSADNFHLDIDSRRIPPPPPPNLCWGAGGPKRYYFVSPDRTTTQNCLRQIAGAGGAWGNPNPADCARFATMRSVPCPASNPGYSGPTSRFPGCTCMNGLKINGSSAPSWGRQWRGP